MSWKGAAIVLAVAVAISAVLYRVVEKPARDGSGNLTTLHWTETVKRAQGDQILISRTVRFRWSTNFGAGRSNNRVEYAALTLTAGAEEVPPWSAPMIPLLLDQEPESGTWWIIATMSDCGFWNHNGEPRPPYWAFNSDGQQWRPAAMPGFVWGRRANLFTRYDSDDTDVILRREVEDRKAADFPRYEGDPLYAVSKASSVRCSSIAS